MLNFLIFSKDRACQLEMLLYSIRKNILLDHKITILYKETVDHKLSYDMLKVNKNGSKNIEFVKEQEFQKTYNNIISSYKKDDNICLLTDDSYFFDKVTYYIKPKVNETFSFRLGYNTIIQDHINKTTQPFLIADEFDGEIISWNPAKYPPVTNYGYPYSFDGHVFTKENLLLALGDNSFKSTNEMEGIMFSRRNLIEKIYSFGHSKLVNIPSNNISGLTASGAFYGYSLLQLRDIFLSGKYVYPVLVPIIGTHQELEFKIV